MPGMFCSSGSAQPLFHFSLVLVSACFAATVGLSQAVVPSCWAFWAQGGRCSSASLWICAEAAALLSLGGHKKGLPGRILEGIRSKNPSGYPFYFLS